MAGSFKHGNVHAGVKKALHFGMPETILASQGRDSYLKNNCLLSTGLSLTS
jgi:hypothetical protein